MSKKFGLSASDIRPIATGHGSCIATDHIMVEGRKVGYMYREEPDGKTDSGWRFFSGLESQAYVDDPEHLAIYDVNTVANYDEDIIAYLSAPIGSAYGRAENGEFVEEDAPSDPDA